MQKKYRLKKNRDFLVCYKRGKNFWNENFTIFFKKSKDLNNRFGISINKKFGKANKRNLIKRRLKEIIRINIDEYINLGFGYDLVVIPKKNTLDLTYDELESSFLKLFRKTKKKVLN